MPWVCPEGHLQNLLRSPWIPASFCLSERAASSPRSECLAWAWGRQCLRTNVPGVMSTTEGWGIMGYTTSCWPLSRTAPHGGSVVWVSAAQAEAHSWTYVYWLCFLPTSRPYSLKSLDSNPCLRLCFWENYLNLHSLGRHSTVTLNCHKTSIFFPSKKRAECDNLNRESSKSKLPGIFAITF